MSPYIKEATLRGTIRLVLSLGVLSAGLPAAGRTAGQPAAPDPAKLAEVLGPDAANWRITGTFDLASEQGQTALVASGGPGLSLESKASFGAPSEYVLQFLLRPAPGASASVEAYMACADRPALQSVRVVASATGGQELVLYSTVRYSTGDPDLKPTGISGALYLQAITDRSLAWSEEMRKTIEAQIASAPKLAQTVLTFRCIIERGRFRCYLNGRFVGELPLPEGVDPSGTIKIQVSPGTQLLSIRVRPVGASDARFEPLSLGGFLNASEIAGQKIDRASLPPPDQTTRIDGVEFCLPAPAPNGEDHVDVGASWTRFGALKGLFAANYGLFGGRWISADRVDPCRLATYVPQGHYKALHLIAAADGQKDKTPVVTAQFYRPDAGHPINFAGRVPELSAKSASGANAVPIRLANGKSAQLYHVVIPLDPDAFSWFSDLDRIGLELTKQVQFYRAYPDPFEYSWHGAGLPSSVHIYAATLERAKVEVDPQPDQLAHVWTAPATPSYTIRLRNRTGAGATVKLGVSTVSYDGKETTTQPDRAVALPAQATIVPVTVQLQPKRYGLHRMKATVSVNGEEIVSQRNLAYLHPETRERGNWAEGKGGLFGYWGYGGAKTDLTTMGQAGAETSLGIYQDNPDPEIRALAAKYQIISEQAFQPHAMYVTAFSPAFVPEMPSKYHPEDPEGTGKALVEELRKIKIAPGPLSNPTYLPFFPEPNVAQRLPSGIYPHHYNGPEYQFTKADEDLYQDQLRRFLIGARAVRKEWPDVKILFPYGDPMNTAIFLEGAPETRPLIDGVGLDLPGFERMPEQQINQVVLNRLYPILHDIKKYVKDPYLVMVEGPCVSSKDIDTSEEEKGDIAVRNFLILLGYGVTHHPSAEPSCECNNYWGEQHYGGGYFSRAPVSMPEVGYVAFATLTRHLNRANHVKYVPTSSTSVFCQQFKHYQTGKLVHVLWTARGKRLVSVKAPAGATLEVYDQNDNLTTLKEKDGQVAFTLDQSPQYLEGLTTDAAIALGESDHSDAQPANEIARLANLGDGSWKLVEKEDLDYAKSNPLQIERFLAKMEAKAVGAPQAQGGKALAVHLGRQDTDRGVMPFYTTLEPKKPITIAGKASHLGLWVHAASDWGRVVYVLRDAKGEKWVSVGTKEDWNSDDIHAWSAFCFDGWRYLRFELPSNAPYDCYREYGSTWWGSYRGRGEGIVDLPLKIEKVIVERRPKVIYGADLVPARPDDVLLGDLYAEYASSADRSSEAVRLSKLRMPTPQGAPELGNAIADLAKTGVGAPTKVLKVTDPAHQYDGTRCHVHFEPVAGAQSYDVWVSPYADGRGAMQLGKGWTESGKLIEGLHPGMDFYAFVVYTDKDGKPSKPSKPFKFVLKDLFPMK